MTPIRTLVALGIAAAAALGLHTVATPTAPAVRTTVQTCHDPGHSWCGGDTFAIDVYVPDGHDRDDGTIPLTTNTHTR